LFLGDDEGKDWLKMSSNHLCNDFVYDIAECDWSVLLGMGHPFLLGIRVRKVALRADKEVGPSSYIKWARFN
jgi:hypothetical protein